MKHRPAWKQATFSFDEPLDSTPPPEPTTRTHAARLKSRGQLTLFDSEPPLLEPKQTESPPSVQAKAPLVEFSSGLVAKARDILAAIRTLKTVEQEEAGFPMYRVVWVSSG